MVKGLTLLGQLRVKAEANASYSRSKFVHWSDLDSDGCDTRKEVLISEATTRPRLGSGCRLTRGAWRSVYDGKNYATYGGLDVDHMVPLKEAWASGARSWTAGTRKAYANDLGYRYSLNAVSASANRSKGDKEPGSWMPSNRAYRCTYVTSWVAVKWRWQLSVDPSEKAGLARQLKACGSVARIAMPRRATIVTGGITSPPTTPPTTPPPTTTPPTSPPTTPPPPPTTTPPPSDGLDPRFPTCTAAKAAGYGPYYRGIDPEYYWYIDRDKDGIVCE